MLIPTANPINLTQSVLSYLPQRNGKITREERSALFIPAFNEEKEIYDTIAAVLAQTRLPNLFIISENGSRDKTRSEIRRCLADHAATNKLVREYQGVKIEEYFIGSCEILLINHDNKTGKAHSVNFAKPLMSAHNIQRVLSIDSDTRLTPEVLELLMDDFYILRQRNQGTYEIHERCMVGGIVESTKEEGTGVIGQTTHKARCAVQDATQYLLRNGQNWTAGFVMPGCCYAVALSSLNVPERTVTEDMDFTWKMELNPEHRRWLTLEEVRERGFQFNGEDLADFLERHGQYSIPLVITPKVYYDTHAVVHTPTPGTIRGLRRQLDRWTYGYVQNLILYNGQLLRNKCLALIVFLGFLVDLWGAILQPLVPTVLLMDYAMGHGGVYLEAACLIVGVQFAIYLTFIFLGCLRRHRMLGRGWAAVFFASWDTLTTLVPTYIYSWFQAVAIVKSVIKGLIDILKGRIESCSGTWIRPTDRESHEPTVQYN